MFTGLIERIGTLAGLTTRDGSACIRIQHSPWDEPLVLGESVAVLGACLTVARVAGPTHFECDILDETLTRTQLKHKRRGARLNLERAVRVGSRLGGHMVSGHVDGQGVLAAISSAGRDRVLRIAADLKIMDGVILKGSIAIDGISLTLSGVSNDSFEVSIIPHTWTGTNLCELQLGDAVNLETDMIGKYVHQYMLRTGVQPGGVDMELLSRSGLV